MNEHNDEIFDLFEKWNVAPIHTEECGGYLVRTANDIDNRPSCSVCGFKFDALLWLRNRLEKRMR